MTMKNNNKINVCIYVYLYTFTYLLYEMCESNATPRNSK